MQQVLRPMMAATLSAAVWLMPATAATQECGSWREPVLCQIGFEASVDRGRWDRFDPGDDHRLAPNQRVAIQLLGRDQFNRDFPRERLALGFDDRECSRMLDIESPGEGRLEIRARSTTGSCRLAIWVPGNRNFEWLVEFEVTSSARTGYSRNEAEFIARSLYRAILGREADAGGLGAAVAEVQAGNVERQVSSMFRSNEFLGGLSSVDANALLDRIYEGLLGRPADSGAVRSYLSRLQRREYAGVVMDVMRSTEFEERLARESR